MFYAHAPAFTFVCKRVVRATGPRGTYSLARNFLNARIIFLSLFRRSRANLHIMRYIPHPPSNDC